MERGDLLKHLFYLGVKGSVGKYHFGFKATGSAANSQKFLALSSADKARRFFKFSRDSAAFWSQKLICRQTLILKVRTDF